MVNTDHYDLKPACIFSQQATAMELLSGHDQVKILLSPGNIYNPFPQIRQYMKMPTGTPFPNGKNYQVLSSYNS